MINEQVYSFGGGGHAPIGGKYVLDKKGDEVFYKGGQFLPEHFSAKVAKKAKTKPILKIVTGIKEGYGALNFDPKFILLYDMRDIMADKKAANNIQKPYKVQLEARRDGATPGIIGASNCKSFSDLLEAQAFIVALSDAGYSFEVENLIKE
jgi:hypothetical protein